MMIDIMILKNPLLVCINRIGERYGDLAQPPCFPPQPYQTRISRRERPSERREL